MFEEFTIWQALCKILLLLVQLGSGYYFYKLTLWFAEIKQAKAYRILAFIGCYFVANVIIYQEDMVNVSLTFLGFILMAAICYKGIIRKKMSAALVLYPIVIALNFILNDIKVLSYYASGESAFMLGLGGVFCYTLVALFWKLLDVTLGPVIARAHEHLDDKAWLLVDTLCLLPLITMFVTLIMTSEEEIIQLYFISVLCIITNIGIFYLTVYLADAMKISKENEILRLQHDYYKTLEENQTEVRKLRHDMNNHLMMIASFVKQKETEKAEHYFDELFEKFRVSNRTFCKNGIVNAILNAKYNLALQNQIDCFFHLAVDEWTPVGEVDLCTIFANTLDNAIEASLKIKDTEKRKITVKAKCENGYFSYRIKNNKENAVLIKDGCYISDKEGGKEKQHGLGLNIIKDTVDKYHGTLAVTNTETEFSVLILI